MKYKVMKNEIPIAINKVLPPDMHKGNTVFVCIGTDRSTGDSFGPLVGAQLEKKKFKVYGTIDNPVHAQNLRSTLDEIHIKHKGKYIIAIDACLGQVTSVGLTEIKRGSIHPGAGVGKDLPAVGDYSITAIVNVGGFMEYFVLQNTRLSLVMGLANSVSKAIVEYFKKPQWSLIAATVEQM